MTLKAIWNNLWSITERITMARLRRALHGVASSYLLLAASAVFSLMSVPIALHYLDKDRFGLWP